MMRRSRLAMQSPPIAQRTTPNRHRRAASPNAAVHAADTPMWTITPPTRLGRARRPGSNVPEARAAASGSAPVNRAHAVDGSPLVIAATAPARSRLPVGNARVVSASARRVVRRADRGGLALRQTVEEELKRIFGADDGF